ncbi:GGDEF domain-containing protein [Paucilactobacillus suebicus]|uniref:Signal transduction diguanylate cyclase n=2 Tax=Paucilactobacillus suebicus TaxID=152335 RepID=A0A0R1WDA3_9LACO|nr:GGDEF domain-containing protein [Paucilactobacillus suebicus]KRM12838.1 Signal transduction diguanylate cyclase [Paucilactobacillus suebicus DSM 5007 = KCTC 3549]
MSFGIVFISYTSSLIANVIVLLGAVSLFTWLEQELNHKFIQKYKNLILCTLGFMFLIFVYMESWGNGHSSNMPIGFHWTYLNVIIVALFNLMIRVKTWWQIVISVLLTIIWASSSGSSVISGAFIAKVLLLLVVEILVYVLAANIERNTLSYFISFTVTACSILAVATSMYHGQDNLSWLRQIFALLLLELAVYGYTKILRHQNMMFLKFKHQAEYDDLTGVHSFGVFNHDLGKLFKDFKEHDTLYAMYALDVDRFKSINDTYGHVAGNEVLKTIAHQIDVLVSQLEYRAKLYRTGGEEFTIILFDIKQNDLRAEEISREISVAVSRLRFNFDDHEVKVTVSIGEERASEDDSNYLDIYKRADQFLYASKHSGRDAITIRGRTLDKEVG